VARRLGDVLHHFLPEAGPGALRRVALPIVAVPLGERDVVRTAFAWNVAVELSRLGGVATVLACDGSGEVGPWTSVTAGGEGAELVFSGARSIADLARAACDLAVVRAADTDEAGAVLACLRPDWLRDAGAGRPLLHHALVFASPDRRDLVDAYALAKRLAAVDRAVRVGVTIHGVASVAEAKRTFGRLARATERHLGLALISYGVLLDELDVYRCTVDRLPVGVARPQSLAARSLRDVAQLLFGDLKDMARA
jgi:hypothetical protein